MGKPNFVLNSLCLFGVAEKAGLIQTEDTWVHTGFPNKISSGLKNPFF
jgi:hypothetical protein